MTLLDVACGVVFVGLFVVIWGFVGWAWWEALHPSDSKRWTKSARSDGRGKT